MTRSARVLFVVLFLLCMTSLAVAKAHAEAKVDVALLIALKGLS
jgi:hypothetical protein